RARKIDSRSRVNAQHRFKNSFAPIRLLRISIPQLLRGDFCNTIPPLATKQRTSICAAKGQKATYAPQHNEWLIRSPRRRAAASKQPQECDTLSRLDYDAIFCPALGNQRGH